MTKFQFAFAALFSGTFFLANSTRASEVILYSFKGGPDGDRPASGLIADANGNLYGTTSIGGKGKAVGGNGTTFMLKPPASGSTVWSKAIIHYHSYGNDAVPVTKLVADGVGNLYGTTSGNPISGSVFELSPPAVGKTNWTDITLHKFKGGSITDGYQPLSAITFSSNGDIYGTTFRGGTGGSTGGVVYKL
jgi:hypothetical protein